MRRESNAVVATLGTILGLLLPNGSYLRAQDDLGILVRPPAEVGSPAEFHPAPPAPTLPPASSRSATAEIAGPSLAISPSTGFPPRRTASSLSLMGTPVSDEPEILVRPPFGADASATLHPISESTNSGLTSISPPILPESDRTEGLNPLLPPGPSARDRVSESPSNRDREARGDRNGMPVERRRSGPLGGLLDRLAGRPSPPPPAAIAPRGARPSEETVTPDDPAGTEPIREMIERAIISREADRIASVEVLIVKQRVHIRAEAARPWQRWALRRGLESLPMPEGYRASVEVR